jgi:hypothetical protein
MIVSPMLLNFRRGGVGGLTNDGDVGAETRSNGLGGENGAVLMALPREYVPEVLTARFFRFLAFFAGVGGRCISKKVDAITCSVLALSGDLNREESMAKALGDMAAAGDSGDGPGDGSVMDEESNVETVVVGEDSVDSEAEVEVLSRG